MPREDLQDRLLHIEKLTGGRSRAPICFSRHVLKARGLCAGGFRAHRSLAAIPRPHLASFGDG